MKSRVHLVEIDLLCGGQRPGEELNAKPLDTDYILLVNRAREGRARRISDIWPVALNEPLPLIPVPLMPPDPDVPLNLRAAMDAVYERAAYTRRINYDKPVPPPELRPAMAEWLRQKETIERGNE